MNQEVTKLQELLARVKRNAALPRTLVSGLAPEPSASAYEPPTAAFSAPAYIPPASEITADEVFFDSEAPPPASVPTAIPPAPVAQAAIDASVDELLLEDPFPSVPPGPSYNDVLEDPLPAAAAGAQLDHEEDVSGVMSISEFSDEQPEELLEDDIVEMTATEAAALPMVTNPLDELSFEDVGLDDKQAAAPSEEEPPASSSRSKVAGTLDEALARAAEQIDLEEDREVPLKTPPPESGPQAAVAMPQGMHAPLAPDIEELLEADILPSAGVRAAVPTAEQVGQTVDLDEARGPSLELDHAETSSVEELEEAVASEELEVTLPGREFGGAYQADLMPPPEARQDLDAHRQRAEEAIAPPPESLAQYPSAVEAQPSGFAPVSAPSSVTTDSYSESVSTVTVDAPANAEFAPELLARPDIGPSPVAKFIRTEVPRPKTFLEMLDSSLSLGSD
ncbi:MAG TPA: hypothetical protein VER11_13000 [Polyangiaceae bacterium]|nr:hypothetical protein [Polyangiaceae bacterium]